MTMTTVKSRVARRPVALPAGVTVTVTNQEVTVKGSKGTLHCNLHSGVKIVQKDGHVHFELNTEVEGANAQSGTLRALINNMVQGVSKGFEKKMVILGVGYRAQAQGAKLNLTVGHSHPVVFTAPAGIQIQTPSQTEIIVSGADRQLVGEVAAKIRAYHKPDPYKGKGIRYVNEVIILKEAKKK